MYLCHVQDYVWMYSKPIYLCTVLHKYLLCKITNVHTNVCIVCMYVCVVYVNNYIYTYMYIHRFISLATTVCTIKYNRYVPVNVAVVAVIITDTNRFKANNDKTVLNHLGGCSKRKLLLCTPVPMGIIQIPVSNHHTEQMNMRKCF